MPSPYRIGPRISTPRRLLTKRDDEAENPAVAAYPAAEAEGRIEPALSQAERRAAGGLSRGYVEPPDFIDIAGPDPTGGQFRRSSSEMIESFETAGIDLVEIKSIEQCLDPEIRERARASSEGSAHQTPSG
jgi:hypothetical protein